MKATALEVTATTAVVELRPCWLARMLGARTVRVELVRIGPGWMTSTTHDVMWPGTSPDREILRALDFRPVTGLPAARTVAP